MLQEAIEYAYNSIFCPSYIKKLGLLQEIIAIKARYQRCKETWQEHLGQVRSLILKKAQGKKKILVLGAGLNYDLPLEELNQSCEEICLVDIFFLQSSLAEIKKFDNVEFVQADITQVLEEVYRYSLKPLKLIARLKNLQFKVPELLEDRDFDLVISLNLASQLPLPLKNYFEKLPIQDEKLASTLVPFYRSMISNHFKYLERFKDKGSELLLISDYEKRVYDKSGELKLVESSLENHNYSEHWQTLANWDWQLAPIGEIDKEYRLELAVAALHPKL